MSLRATALCLAALLAVPAPCHGQADNDRPKTNVGAVATANPAATAAAVKMLEHGGTAADAAIAAQMVLAVVEPQSSGLGGGAVILYREASRGPIRAFDGLARSPAGYDPKASSSKAFPHSGASVGVPGTLRVLELLHAHYGALRGQPFSVPQ